MLTLLNESLWGDECFSALAVMKRFPEMMAVVLKDTAPPGFYILGYIWGRLFGFSEVALRTLSLLLMLGAAVFSGLIVYQLTKKRLIAVLTGLVAFLSPFSFIYAFEWRMYALLTFTTLGSIYFFVARKWKWYVVMTVLALYTHHLALFTLAGQGLWFLGTEFSGQGKWGLEKLKRIVRHLWPFWLVLLLYLPWLYPMYLQVTRVQGAGFWLQAPTVNQALDLLYRFFTAGVKESWRGLTAILGMGLLVFKDWRQWAKKWLEVLWVVMAPLLFSFLMSYLVTPVFYDRYLLSVVLGMAVLLGLGARRQGIALMLVLLLIYGYSSYWLLLHPLKRPFREFSQLVKQELREGDKLVNYHGQAHHIWESQYYAIPGPIYLASGELPLWVGTAQMKPEDIVKQLPEADRVGLITSEPVEKVELPQDWQISGVTELGNLKVIWLYLRLME